MLTKVVRNLLWQREDEPQNLLSYIFLGVSLYYGFAFTFFSDSNVAMRSAFKQERVPLELWGAAVLLITLATLYSIAFRPRCLGVYCGMLGMIIWGYGLCLYVLSDDLWAGVVIYLPQVIFWSFFYVGVKRFYLREDAMEDEL